MRPNVLRAHRSHEGSVRNSHLFDYRLILALLVLTAAPAAAQAPVQFNVTSTFNADLIVNDSTFFDVDDVNDPIDDPATSNRTFVTQAAAESLSCVGPVGLPNNGFFAANADHPDVQMAYDNENDGINARRSELFDIFTFGVPQFNYSNVHLFMTAGNGTAQVTVTLIYTTGPDDPYLFTVPDWFHDTPAGVYALFNFGDRAFATPPAFGERCENSNTVAIFGFNIDADETRVLQSIIVDRNVVEPSILGFFGATGVRVLPADLSVTKTDSADPVTAGTNLTYTLTLNNAGPGAAQDVVLDDQQGDDPNVIFVSMDQTSGPAFTLNKPLVGEASFTASATAATLAAGASATFSLVVHVNSGTPNGSNLTNTLSVTTSSPEVTLANNSETETTGVDAAADLAVTKTDSPDPVTAGQNLTYTLTLSNAGPSVAQTVALTDIINNPHVSFVSMDQTSGPPFLLTKPPVGGHGLVSGTTDFLLPGAVATFTLVVQVNPGTPGGSQVTNTVLFNSSTTDPNPANHLVTEITDVAAPNADLSVTKSDSPDPVTAGTNLSYIITLNNAGPNEAADVQLTDAIPAGTTAVAFTQIFGPAFNLSTSASAFTATAATFAPGTTALFQAIVRVDPSKPAGSTITNTASVAAATPDLNSSNNSDTEITDVSAGTRRGDVNGDGFINVLDVFYLINHLYNSGPPPVGSGDTNSDSSVNAADVTFLLNYLFGNGPPPA